MTEQPYWWEAEESFRARQEALRQGRGEESRGPVEEDVPTADEVDRSER